MPACPRTLAALLCGSALAVGGVIIQGVLGNPLAGPQYHRGECRRRPGGSPLRRPDSDLYDGGPGGQLSWGRWGRVCWCTPWPGETGASRITLVLAGVAISSMLSAAIDAVSILFPEAALGAGSFMVGRLSGVTVAALKVPGPALPPGRGGGLCHEL